MKQRRHLWVWALLGLAVLVIAPFAMAGGAGRLIGSLWVSTMGAVMSIIAGMFGG